MRKIIKLSLVFISLASCNNKSNDVGTLYHKCVIQNIKEIERSSLDIEKKYIIDTDCGKSITKTNQGLKVGDTIIIRK
jgi:uncharacterized lipoprotein NlpE involved in copper resistance